MQENYDKVIKPERIASISLKNEEILLIICNKALLQVSEQRTTNITSLCASVERRLSEARGLRNIVSW